MLVAKINEDNTITLSHFKDMFPHTSFTSLGPSDEFLEENGCYKVSMIRDYDPNVETLEPCPAHVENGIVYTTRVVPIQNL